MFGHSGCGSKGFGGGHLGFGPPQWLQRKLMGAQACGPGALLSDLDLTDEQLEKLAELKMEGLSKFGQFKSGICGFIQQIAKELTKDQIDKAKIHEIAQQAQSHKAEMGASMVDRVIAFAEVLTPEQRKKLRSKLVRRFLGVDQQESECE
jgi:Spy/CpxP family protein refolding chaperone